MACGAGPYSALFFVRVWDFGTGGDPALSKVLIGLRAVALTLVLFLLLGPALVAQRLEPGTHFVPVLFDDSRSMTVPEYDGQARQSDLCRCISRRILSAF